MLLGLSLLVLASVTPASPTARPLSPLDDPSAIYGGDIVPTGMWPEVVAIEIGSLLCTGTVVAEQLVLTAAHCFTPGLNPATIRITFGDSVYSNDTRTVASAYGMHPEFCSDTDTCEEDIHDFAYIVLRERVTGITFPRVMGTQEEWDASMYVDNEVTLVGFGISETLSLGIKRMVSTTISAFSETGSEFRAGGEGKDSCQGDSGGPAFVRLQNHEYVLAGITSRGYDCGVGGFYGVPYPVLCWLEEETGIDLKRDGCADCSCLDKDPARGTSGCALTRPQRPREELGPLALALLLGIITFARRRLVTR
jgi:hypothetical protein